MSQQIFKDIENAWSATNGIYEKFTLRLQAQGIVMANDLLPEKVRTALWTNRDKTQAIQVFSEEPFIPWELLYVINSKVGPAGGKGFLGEWGLRTLAAGHPPARSAARSAPRRPCASRGSRLSRSEVEARRSRPGTWHAATPVRKGRSGSGRQRGGRPISVWGGRDLRPASLCVSWRSRTTSRCSRPIS